MTVSFGHPKTTPNTQGSAAWLTSEPFILARQCLSVGAKMSSVSEAPHVNTISFTERKDWRRSKRWGHRGGGREIFLALHFIFFTNGQQCWKYNDSILATVFSLVVHKVNYYILNGVFSVAYEFLASAVFPSVVVSCYAIDSYLANHWDWGSRLYCR